MTNWEDPSCSRPPQCRPRLLGIRNSDSIHISGLFINDAIFWTLHIVNSSHVSLSNLKIRGDPGIPNNDGIDVDSSEHVSISGIDVDTADDALCIKTTEPGRHTAHVAVRGAILASRSAALKFGSESVADIHNVTISDVEVRACGSSFFPQLRVSVGSCRHSSHVTQHAAIAAPPSRVPQHRPHSLAAPARCRHGPLVKQG